jgi:ABC-type transport system involved in cytochrome c biogenesis permease subunit
MQYFFNMRFLYSVLVLLPCLLFSTDAPVSDNGRIRPFTAHAMDWLYDNYHAAKIKEEHKDLLPIPIDSAEELLWALHLLGHEPFDSFPLFYSEGKWKSYGELKWHEVEEPLLGKLKLYEMMGSYNGNPEVPLHLSAPDMKMLPSYGNLGIWIPLKSVISVKENPSAYPDSEYLRIRGAYSSLQNAARAGDYPEAARLRQELVNILARNYQSIAGKPVLQSSYNELNLPGAWQLSMENLYYRLPWVWIAIGLYTISFILLLTAPKFGIWAFLSAFAVHTFVLALRCFILGRPPVSNMQETILYVPWVAVFFSWLLYFLLKNRIAISAAAGAAVILLTLNQVTYGSYGLSTVQPVLNSQFWLTTHVLMVVGSYGAFILSGILAHYYLIATVFQKAPKLPKLILQTLYIGTALLITGTILGGVWAAQSWGRFWDWDPKESWAFISSCTYLVIIHAYRFGKIGSLGLAIGSILGLQAITFTWYGVNYILGVGLHSYGFGSGGEHFYAFFTGFEVFFALFMLIFHLSRQKSADTPLS